MWRVWVRRGGFIGSWWWNRRERDHWRDLGVDGWIILGWISRRYDVGISTGLGWPRIETGGGKLVSAVMNLRVPWNAGNFLTSCKPVSFSRRTLHHGVSKFDGISYLRYCHLILGWDTKIFTALFWVFPHCLFWEMLQYFLEAVHDHYCPLLKLSLIFFDDFIISHMNLRLVDRTTAPCRNSTGMEAASWKGKSARSGQIQKDQVETLHKQGTTRWGFAGSRHFHDEFPRGRRRRDVHPHHHEYGVGPLQRRQHRKYNKRHRRKDHSTGGRNFSGEFTTFTYPIDKEKYNCRLINSFLLVL